MDFKLNNTVSSFDISSKFDLIHIGKKITIEAIGLVNTQNHNSIYWAKNKVFLDERECGIVVCSNLDFKLIRKNENVTYLISDKSPKLIFSKILNEILKSDFNSDFINKIDDFKNKSITVGENVFIGENVKIGKGTIIHHNVSIYSNTTIGENCVIQSNVSIGTEGLGLELDPETDLYVKFPQIGGVIIEDYVEIGPGSTVRRAALDNTTIRKGTKIGALCNIGHNCIIGKNCILTCNIITSGSSIIGDYSFLGVGSIIKNGINIGDKVTLGQGSIVVKNIPEGETWIGNPARKI